MATATGAVGAASLSGPIAPSERIELVDILRGFAVFGILLVNMESFAWPVYLDGLREWPLLVDRVAAWVIRFLAQGKFYPLFSFLFGFGLTIQMARAAARGMRFVPLYLRRLLVLLLIGAAHALLLWMGDILVSYAVLGFLLILFRHRSRKALIIWAVIFALIPILFVGSAAWLVDYGRILPGAAVPGAQGDSGSDVGLQLLERRAIRVYSRGTFGEIFQQRLRDLRLVYAVSLFAVWDVFAMFLLGLYAGRRGVFQDFSSHLPFVRRLMPWALGIGLVGNLVSLISAEHGRESGSLLVDLVSLTARVIGGPALAVFYMCAIALLLQRDVWRGRLQPLAAVGRMALSNYLFQSLVCTTIFYSYGLGLFGQVGPALGIVLTAVIYAVQVPLSRWWLARFRFGPVEWLWRSLTYGKLQPTRVAEA